jgi:hypothetical protein
VTLGPDILLTHTPTPLNPAETLQQHTWYAAWQAVGHVADRAGLPLGLYRLHVEGESYAGGSTSYPWAKEPYTVDSPAFEVVPATITLTRDGPDLLASLDAPARGYRHVAEGGHVRGTNPLPASDVRCDWTLDAGQTGSSTGRGERTADGRTRLVGVLDDRAVAVTCEDALGNVGAWTRAE